MAKKPAKGPAKAGPKDPKEGTADSLIAMLARRVGGGDGVVAPLLYRMVASRVGSRVLELSEAEVIAQWFERLAAGEAPAEVFRTATAGRPKGKTKPRKPMRDGRIPDDYDIARIVKQNIGLAPVGEIYAGVAKAFGMEPGTVANIYKRLKKDIP